MYKLAAEFVAAVIPVPTTAADEDKQNDNDPPAVVIPKPKHGRSPFV